MAFGYGFIDLSDEEKYARRRANDAHGYYVQLSVLLIIVVVRLSSWTSHLFSKYFPFEDGPPKSPFLRPGQQKGDWIRRFRIFWNRFYWLCGSPLIRGWGTCGEWLFGLLWTIWLVYLCVRNTAPDYWHVTKRFGMIPTALLPIHYLLAMRSSFSPIQLLTGFNHQDLKASHVILGRIIISLYTVHGGLYLNGFAQLDVLSKRLLDFDVIFGLSALTSFILIGTTALSFIRNWSYRAFYFVHIVLALLLLEPMYFHCSHTHMFVWETLVVIVFLNTFRAFKIRTWSGCVTIVPGTSLVQVEVPYDSRQDWDAGQHVFLSQVSISSQKFGLYDLFNQWFSVNPFTVANLPNEDRELLLIARTLKGSTRLLAAAARSESKTSIPLTIGGPYRDSPYLSDFARFDKILFVAGGVGATYVVPLFRVAIKQANKHSKERIKFVWAVRSLAETRWALPNGDGKRQSSRVSPGEEPIEIFVTQRARTIAKESGTKEESDDIELAEGEHLLPDEAPIEEVAPDGAVVKNGRPDIRSIVDSTFADAQGAVAVFTCGPRTLTDNLRRAVGTWVYRGREVYYKAEVFAY